MATVVTVADMRRLEQAAVESGTSYDALMEQAGAAATAFLCERYINGALSPRVLILCGSGNNGGDGYVIARCLATQTPPVSVTVVQTDMPATPLAVEKAALLPATVTVVDVDAFLEQQEAYTVIVDAVYGIGFRGTLSPRHKRVFAHINAASTPVVAVDIPSGVNADTGVADGDCVIADATVTFTAAKPASLLTASALFGELVVADVGIDDGLCRAYETTMIPVSEQLVAQMMPPRPIDGHKGTFGRVLSVCGSYGMVGAALLSGKAALRMGVGLLHMALPRSAYPIAASALWEAVYHPLPETTEGTFGMDALTPLTALATDKQAMLIGCGLSQHAETRQLLLQWLPTLSAPTVIDADGLNLLNAHIVMLKAMTAPLVLTPHPAEAARLLGMTVAQVERDRVGAVRRLANETGATVVLKGHRTLITAPDCAVYINTTGNSGMATGGSGDVLSGMIAALLARGMAPLDAVICGVFLHGAAGDEAAARRSETALMPTDLIEELARLLSHFEKRE